MARAGGVVLMAMCVWAAAAVAASAAEPPEPWDGVNPFNCVLQQAGYGTQVPHPEADPFCIEYEKRQQNVTQLGVVEFVAQEPARVALASPKCFYFQSDHWRGSVVQENGATETYEWDGHYFFDKATGDGGAWLTNFTFNGRSGDASTLPGFPPEYDPYFGPGTGGSRTHNAVPTDPVCAERAAREGSRIYARPPANRPRCVAAGGVVTPSRLGPVALGATEAAVRRSLGPPLEIKRGFLRYCVSGAGRFLVGQREDRSGELGAGADERTVVLIASARGFRHRGVGVGSRVRALRRKLRRARRAFRYGPTAVYLARPRSAVLFGVRRGRVRFVAVRDRSAVRGKRSVRAYLRRAR